MNLTSSSKNLVEFEFFRDTENNPPNLPGLVVTKEELENIPPIDAALSSRKKGVRVCF